MGRVGQLGKGWMCPWSQPQCRSCHGGPIVVPGQQQQLQQPSCCPGSGEVCSWAASCCLLCAASPWTPWEMHIPSCLLVCCSHGSKFQLHWKWELCVQLRPAGDWGWGLGLGLPTLCPHRDTHTSPCKSHHWASRVVISDYKLPQRDYFWGDQLKPVLAVVCQGQGVGLGAGTDPQASPASLGISLSTDPGLQHSLSLHKHTWGSIEI